MTKGIGAVASREYVMTVPELKGGGVFGGGCCAMPMDFLIRAALKEVDEVVEVSVSEKEGLVRVWTSGEAGPRLDEVKARVEDLGLRVSSLEAAPQDSGACPQPNERPPRDRSGPPPPRRARLSSGAGVGEKGLTRCPSS